MRRRRGVSERAMLQKPHRRAVGRHTLLRAVWVRRPDHEDPQAVSHRGECQPFSQFQLPAR